MILVAGAVLRAAAFGDVPTGLGQDEVSAGIEAEAIWRTGKDRWGFPYPVYFPAWGSGMNALAPYLMAPLVGILGNNVVSLRLLGLMLGLLTLPLTYATARLIFDRTVALVATALIAVLPWHVMMTRWLLESSLLPFWLLLGIFTVAKALQPNASVAMRLVALIPWAIGVYAYALVLLVLPILVVLAGIQYRRAIARHLGQWLIGAGLAGLVTAPLLLFLIKNSFVGAPLPLEGALPFSLPLLPASRFEEIHLGLSQALSRNLLFVVRGFNDALPWNSSVHFAPLSHPLPVFGAIGLVLLLLRPEQRRGGRLVPFLALSYLPTFLLFEANVNRVNGFMLAMLLLGAVGIVETGRSLSASAVRRAFVIALGGYYVAHTMGFAGYYFRAYNREIASAFRDGLGEALSVAADLAAPNEPIFVPDDGSHLTYVYVLFYTRFPIQLFQDTAEFRVTPSGIYEVQQFGRFVFDRGKLDHQGSFVFVTAPGREPVCPAPTVLAEPGRWQVGRCQTAASSRPAAQGTYLAAAGTRCRRRSTPCRSGRLTPAQGHS